MLRETISLVARSSFKSMLNSGRRLSPGGDRDSWPTPVGDAVKSKPLSPHAASTDVVQDSRKRTIFDALFFFSGPKKSRYTCTVKIDQAPIVITITRTALVSRSTLYRTLAASMAVSPLSSIDRTLQPF
jgi:hypothetical protein